MLLRHIRYFLAVAEHRHFTRAAEALHVSQPTLSQQIRQLEEALGAELFDRGSRRLRLTDAGEAYQVHARRALRDLDAGRRALHDVATLQRGQLRLAMTPTFTAWLAGPLLARFHRRHPGIALTVREMSQEAMEAGLAEDILDIGIGFAPARTLDVEATPLLDERLALIAGDSHPLAARETVLSLADLEAMPLVLLSADFITRRHVDDYCLRHGIRPTVAVEVNSMGAAVEIIRHGELAGILPAAVAASQPGLAVLALSPALPGRQAALLAKRDGYRSAAARAFAELARAGLGAMA
ncbi:transcriptional regulator [Chromobacterium violaceum]|uniref:transcriptional regulator CynR n=1 Tax=Chromobacterium violaceum TaxID=536 RepID=UPI00065440AA|nr:transcriptional regulator CynR [Chromobacterium violaceum]KMN51000.1 transcriptional regulator [Chromobacterium violaceum]KMN86279.1 transcriptional regulator [Chromobacterium violaceum]KMN89843.1 transcriptional regulator [Chromobacterium violaceum]KMO04988.1 transcriptional regulator [Chromobacterium violaceum]